MVLSRRQWLATLGSTFAAARALPGLGDAVLMASSPGPRAGHVLVYEPGRHTCCLLGGYQGKPPRDEIIWRWNGSSWKVSGTNASAAPLARALGAAAFDDKLGKLVYFGGLVLQTGKPTGDLWLLDGDTWDSNREGSPGPRDHHAAAYDSKRQRLIVYGGQNGDRSWISDTWEFDGKKWHGIPTTPAAPAPGARAHHAMAYDAARGRTVLFGGIGADGQHRDDTWEWDGTRWTEIKVAGPAARARHRMVFDAGRGVSLLFGGDTGNPSAGQWTLSDETWTWNGAAWQKLQPAASPSPRMAHALAYDADRRRVVLFGGQTADATVEETWEWDGQTWTFHS
jgi:hypothetical protein